MKGMIRQCCHAYSIDEAFESLCFIYVHVHINFLLSLIMYYTCALCMLHVLQCVYMCVC